MNILKKKFPLFLTFLRYLFGIFLVMYLIRKGEFNFKDIFSKLSLFELIVLFAIKLIILSLVSFRWSIVLLELKVSIHFRQAFMLNIQTTLFNYFVPGNASSDLFKSFYAASIYKQTGRIIISTLIDRVIGLGTLCVLFIGAFFSSYVFGEQNNLMRLLSLIKFSSSIYCAFLVILMLLIVVFSLSLYFRAKLILFFNSVLTLKKVEFWRKTFTITLLSHLLFAVFLYLTAQFLSLRDISLLSCLVVFPIATIAMVVPLTPGSIGVGQILYGSLFSLYAGQLIDASSIFTVSQLIDIPIVIIGLFLMMKSKPRKDA